MIVLQLLLYCLLFTAMVKIAVIGGAVNGLYFYPKEMQDRAIELGMIDRNTMNRKRKCFMIPLRRWTKGYTIKQPNMDCQPTEITALMRHRAVFS